MTTIGSQMTTDDNDVMTKTNIEIFAANDGDVLHGNNDGTD